MGAAERYVLGELTEEDRTRYEEHFFDCAQCAENVRSAAVFVASAKNVLGEDIKERVDMRASDRTRPGWLALFWPAPAGAVAALFLLVGVAGYQSVFVVPDLRRELARAEAPQAAPRYFLPESRSGPRVVEVSSATRIVGLTLSKSSARTFPYYRCEVRALGGRMVSSAVVPGPGPRRELEILLPVSGMEPGQYELHLAGLESASSAVASDLVRYPFTLQIAEE